MFSPQDNPKHSVHSTNTYGAPTACWVYGHSEASKVPVLMEFTTQERTKDRVLSPNVSSLLWQETYHWPQLDCHLSELPFYRMGR